MTVAALGQQSVVLGLPLLAIERAALPDLLADCVASRRPNQIALGTMSEAVTCDRDVLRQTILAECTAVLCASSALAWAAGRLGVAIPAPFTGGEIADIVAKLVAEKGWRLGLLGPQKEDLTAAAARLSVAHPTLSPPTLLHGPVADEDWQREQIRNANLQVLLVGLPPAIETEWVYRQLPWLDTPLLIGIGDGLAVTAGRVSRVPTAWGRRGLAWVHWWLHHPWARTLKYSAQLVFFIRRFKDQSRGLDSRDVVSAGTPTIPADLRLVVWAGRIESGTVESLPACEIAETPSGLLLDLRAVVFMDSFGLGRLVSLYREVKNQGAGLVLLAPSPYVLNLLAAVHLDRLFVCATTVDSAVEQCRQQTPGMTPHLEPSGPGELVLSCQGDLTAPRLAAASRWLNEAWRRHPTSNHLSLNLSHVRLIDSSGIGWLLKIRRLTRKRGGELSLRGVTGQPDLLLRQTHLDRLFETS